MSGEKIGLALGGGSARGLAHIGVLDVLLEKGVSVSCVAGTSMGALIGGAFASGVSPSELEDIACNVDLRLMAKLFTPTFSASGFIDGSRIEDLLRTLIGDKTFSDLKIPFAAVSCNLRTGEEVIITSGSLIEAIRASISIPILFSPVRYKGCFLVDGGLVNPVPVNVVRGIGADNVIAVNVLPPPEKRLKSISLGAGNIRKHRPKRGRMMSPSLINSWVMEYVQKKVKSIDVLERFSKLLRKQQFSIGKESSPNMPGIMMQTLLIMEYEIARQRLLYEKPEILIEPDTSRIHPMDFHKAPLALEVGREAARSSL
ncbi:MAG: patatin-like phospholipase family protein [Candidatus Tritonobacter lacicola]|nr:patatin-like phospholipase family protein [Candidatus Tritonobacter lacicola]